MAGILRKGERNPRRMAKEKREVIELVMRIRGMTPMEGRRLEYFKRMLKKGHRPGDVVVQHTLKRAFRSIVDSTGILDTRTKQEIAKVVNGLREQGKIVLKRGARADFTGVRARLEELIGKQGAEQFIKEFSEFLVEERNFMVSELKSGRGRFEKEW